SGLTNIKVADLEPEVLQKLGYPPPPGSAKSATSNVTAWAKQSMAKIGVPQMKQVEDQVKEAYHGRLPNGQPTLSLITPNVVGIVLGLYLFYCHCCRLICLKTGQKPSPLVWVPGLQMLLLLKAAGMSPVWFLAYILGVPG